MANGGQKLYSKFEWDSICIDFAEIYTNVLCLLFVND